MKAVQSTLTSESSGILYDAMFKAVRRGTSRAVYDALVPTTEDMAKHMDTDVEYEAAE